MNAHAEVETDAALAQLIRRELMEIRPGKLSGDWPDTASFTEDLGIDSLDLVELVARLEQAAGLFVPDEDLPRLASVSATVDYIRARQAADG